MKVSLILIIITFVFTFAWCTFGFRIAIIQNCTINIYKTDYQYSENCVLKQLRCDFRMMQRQALCKLVKKNMWLS